MIRSRLHHATIASLAAALFVTTAPGAGAQTVTVPTGSGQPVLLDGRITEQEWDDAAAIAFADGFTLQVKQHRGDVFLAVRMDGPVPRPVDLYLHGDDGSIHQLHASMQIGERLLPGFGWSDTVPAWRWGNHVDWIANEAKLDSEVPRDSSLARRLFPADGVEFQIRRSRFASERWRVRIEIGSFAARGPTLVFPAASTRDDAVRWAVLELGPL